MEEELPTFRPFTREELATIENRIFENKLEAKKKQEQRDKNIAVRKIAIPILISVEDWINKEQKISALSAGIFNLLLENLGCRMEFLFAKICKFPGVPV